MPEQVRITLLLGGGVSLGTFASGALLEVLRHLLDANARRAAEHKPPIQIDAVTGASAGSMTLATAMLRALRGESIEEIEVGLRRDWIDDADVDHLLWPPGALLRPKVFSLLNPHAVYASARRQLLDADRPDDPDGETAGLFADGTLASFALTNLQGNPVHGDEVLAAQRDRELADAMHTTYFHDAMRFCLHRDPAAIPWNAETLRDEAIIPLPWRKATATEGDWERFALAAVASGAFPAAFPPVSIRREPNDYPRGDWPRRHHPGPAVGTQPFVFDFVDGGVLRNEPLKAAIHLSKLQDAAIEAGGDSVRRHYLFIDANVSGTGERWHPGLPQGASVSAGDPMTLLPALLRVGALAMSQATFRDWLRTEKRNAEGATPIDIVPITPAAGSAPHREHQLAGAFLANFGGFFDRALRTYDFARGQDAARQALERTFATAPAAPAVDPGDHPYENKKVMKNVNARADQLAEHIHDRSHTLLFDLIGRGPASILGMLLPTALIKEVVRSQARTGIRRALAAPTTRDLLALDFVLDLVVRLPVSGRRGAAQEVPIQLAGLITLAVDFAGEPKHALDVETLTARTDTPTVNLKATKISHPKGRTRCRVTLVRIEQQRRTGSHIRRDTETGTFDLHLEFDDAAFDTEVIERASWMRNPSLVQQVDTPLKLKLVRGKRRGGAGDPINLDPDCIRDDARQTDLTAFGDD